MNEFGQLNKINVEGDENIILQDINNSTITINTNNSGELMKFFTDFGERFNEFEKQLSTSNNVLLKVFMDKFSEFKNNSQRQDDTKLLENELARKLKHLLELKKIEEKNLNSAEIAIAQWAELAPPILLHRKETATMELERINAEITKIQKIND